MKIAFLTASYGAEQGVLGRHVEALARAATLAGHTVEVLLCDQPRAASARPDHGITVIRFRHLPHLDCSIGSGIAAYLRGQGAWLDLLHVHGRPPLAAVRAVHETSARVIFTPHYYARAPRELLSLAQGRRHRLDREILTAADLVLCVSHSEALQVRRYAPDASLEVIPNGVDAEEIAAARPRAVSGRLILTVDRLTRWTGVQRIISALPALSPSYRLIVIGRGRAQRMLEAHADFLQVSDRVRFLGAVDDAEMHRWLRTASVLVTLKEESLWGGILLAATAAGTPIVASDIPANREAAVLTEQDRIAFVSRRASPFAVADAIRAQVGAGSRPHPDLTPTWEEIAEETVAVYSQVQERVTA